MNIFDKLTDFKYKRNLGLVNLTEGFFAFLVKKFFHSENRPILIVAPNMLDARKLYNKFEDNVILFEDDEISCSDGVVVSPELRVERINILSELILDNKHIVITDISGFTRKLPSVESFKKQNISFSIGDTFFQKKIISFLKAFGYTRTSIVNKTGDFAIRGFVLDIFPVNSFNPVRIEFFGDEIDSIRYFDVDTQKSIEKISNITILPFKEVLTNDNSSIYDYLQNPIVIYKDYEQIKFSYNKMVSESVELDYSFNEYYFDLSSFDVKDCLYYFDFDSNIGEYALSDVVSFNASNISLFGENFSLINKYIRESIESSKTVVLCVSTFNLNDFLDKLELPYVITDFDNIFENKVNVVRKKLVEGFEKDNYVFLTDYELFGKKSFKYKQTRFKNTSKIRDLSKIEIGDYVVHNVYGIGIYNGIKALNKGSLVSDYIEVLYAKGDKLYIPASKIELISKYNGKDGYVPKISSLNSTSWVKAKQRIREKIRIEAEKLIRIQAERQIKKGFSFSKDGPLQEMFESEFVHEITLDQSRVIAEIKKDMESTSPMDRILCGDVGYGKTEVAFRAMFKAVLDNKQVLYLCPTTVLCRQQYEVALDRFKNYPVNIGVLNRFVTPSVTKNTLEKLEKGEIDILFATHRGLSSDVIFKDLGLLVIDEEQRFGVIQKEKIKEMKSNIDVLTLTATPIPRTLQMAVLGIKNLSLIETPPKNRKSVITYVTPFDKKLIREIVYKEVSRGGQVFILYNRVEDIEQKVFMFRELLPDVSLNFAHGKLDRESFENVMNDFVDNKFDVLVCTTIIETGIDIPNVNSLIIMDADKFGLSQLYQIRGRVGRSDSIAYAYLMYDKGKVLTEKAVKRLKVIKEFTELGSGFAIAAKDLSIRGAGDILGSDQAGFIDSVGIDLYLKMLDEEVNRIKGIEPLEDENLDSIKIDVSSHIKDSYVDDEDIKIEIHKMINSIDSFETLEKVKNTISDRFGPIDNDLFSYMNEQLFESFCNKFSISKVFDNSVYREIVFNKEMSNRINYEDLFIKALAINNKFIFSYKNEMLIVKLEYKNCTSCVAEYFNNLFKEL